MIKKMIVLCVLFSTLLLSACGGVVTPQPAAESATLESTVVVEASATIDPCAPQYERVLAQRVHKHMREFDDASTLAASLTADKLPSAIAELQRIRRDSQDEPVPSCLGKLKDLQVAHMNMVIDTLLGMLNGAKPEDLQTGISNSRQLHDAYTVELANVLGLTVVANSTAVPVAQTPAAGAVTVSNAGVGPVNMRATPDLNGAIVTALAVNEVAAVLGKSADGTWVQVEVAAQPGTKAWIFLATVTLSGSLDAVPVVTP